MLMTIYIPSDDFDEALEAIQAQFRPGELVVESHKKKRYIHIDVDDHVQAVHSKILSACPEARIEGHG